MAADIGEQRGRVGLGGCEVDDAQDRASTEGFPVEGADAEFEQEHLSDVWEQAGDGGGWQAGADGGDVEPG